MSTEPLVTIGCAVYNGEAILARALASVVGQEYSNLEILIADDCSTDRSLEICEAVAGQDPRVRIIRHPANIGLSRNFNQLFREARGKYFMWADQDDIRDRTFVRKTVAALEADPDAVLCHSHTGEFIGDPDDLKIIVTLKGISDVKSPIARYLRFLRHYSDTTIYGLIRSDALRRTRLWRHSLGSANALLFELLVQGRFIEVPEMLYRYSARGLKARPSVKEEYERLNKGKTMPRHYLPFLVLAFNQTDGIVHSSLRWFEKAVLVCGLWLHVSVVFVTKVVYRAMHRISFGRLPDSFTSLCDAIVEARPDRVVVHEADRHRLLPKGWTLKGESLRRESHDRT
jgi:glycosyltransferase involved in cell wall biosynthesis